jgi:hypothetical protein
MKETYQEILQELDKLETAIDGAIGACKNARHQTNIESAILTRENESLKIANEQAIAYITEGISILKKLKAGN